MKLNFISWNYVFISNWLVKKKKSSIYIMIFLHHKKFGIYDANLCFIDLD